MTEQEIKDMLSATGVTTYRGHAPKGTRVPYIVINLDYTSNFGADDVVYLKVPTVEARLYNTKPDPLVSAKIEKALTDAGIFWTADEADSPEESLFIINYYFGGLNNANSR